MSAAKFKQFGALGIGTLVASGLYYVDLNNLLNNICKKKYKTTESIKRIAEWNYEWDKENDETVSQVIKNSSDLEKLKLEDEKIKAKRHIILVRHGQYNLKGETDDENYLTDLGKSQAKATGLRLAQLKLSNLAIVKSTMKRALQTSELIESYLPEVPVMSDPLLREGCPTEPVPNYANWKCNHEPRIEVAFKKYIHRAKSSKEKDSHTILVCHGNVIRYFICRALQIPPERWLTMTLNHASITWITIYPNGRVALCSAGDCGHLLPEQITYT